MADENKIETSSDKFLPRQIVDQETHQHNYSIDEEFSKTKKNRSLFFYFVVGGFLCLLLFLTYAITTFIHKSYEAGVGAGLIQDIQLKNLFLEHQGVYDKLKLSMQSIESLKKEREEESALLRRNYNKELQSLKQKKLSSKEHQAAQRKETRDFKKKLQELKEKYAKDIRDKRRKAQKLAKQAKQKERLLEQKASQMKEIANNYGQLQELRLAQQLLKFNPIIKGKIFKQILKERNEFSPADSIALLSYPRDVEQSPQAAKIEEDSFEKRISNIEKRNALLRRLLKVPYTNSVPTLLKRLDSLNKNINQSYEKLWQGLYTQLRSEKIKLDSLQYAIAFYSKHLNKGVKSLAYVIDGRDLQNIYLHVDQDAQIDTPLTALILRGEDDEIARVKIFRVASEYRAQLVEMLDSDGIQPFDRLVIASEED